MIPNEIKLQYSDIDWKAMGRMRDRLIHHYFGVDYAVVWDTVISDIPGLRKKINSLINDLKQ